MNQSCFLIYGSPSCIWFRRAICLARHVNSQLPEEYQALVYPIDPSRWETVLNKKNAEHNISPPHRTCPMVLVADCQAIPNEMSSKEKQKAISNGNWPPKPKNVSLYGGFRELEVFIQENFPSVDCSKCRTIY